MMTKEVTDQRLQNYVLHSDELLTFAAWWKTLDDDEVEVQFPHERHGLAGRLSNHSKQDVMAHFLEIVDANSQPNGRQAGSYCAQFFHPNFTRIAPPREGEKITMKRHVPPSCKSSIACRGSKEGVPVVLLPRVNGFNSIRQRWPCIQA